MIIDPIPESTELGPLAKGVMLELAQADLVRARRYQERAYHGNDAPGRLGKLQFPNHKNTRCQPCDYGEQIAIAEVRRAQERVRLYGGRTRG